ncbi:hypothetical protein PR048_009075 [Dryococelus australis]|uniref:Uncharacterized protein n=1 Tax=Dryococelus australis TaxID=614101 RepID=A0ABQ9HYW2_9NEOP|nr:hypothetical protein PR048_009075 [Dryococelus australis]
MHNCDTIDETTGDMCKPEVITFYNLTKGGVNVVDDIKASYSVSRISNCWPFNVFFTIMNIACIKSLIIYKCTTNDQQSRTYRKKTVFGSRETHLVTRAFMPTHPGQLVSQDKWVSGLQVVDNQPPPTEGFCGIHPRRKNGRTKKIYAR